MVYCTTGDTDPPPTCRAGALLPGYGQGTVVSGQGCVDPSPGTNASGCKSCTDSGIAVINGGSMVVAPKDLPCPGDPSDGL